MSTDIRVGLGFDLHRLVEGRPCILGGLELPHSAGPGGHSDGDAVLHSICDALLGAAGLDDLGTLFPDTEDRWKDADSAHFLTLVVERVQEAGWTVGNVDVVIATEGPHIADQRGRMRVRIAELLEISPENVNVKGKTLEGLWSAAKGAAVTVQAVCLLRR